MSIKRRLELAEGSSSKFWEAWTSGAELHVQYGKLGASGQTRAKSYPSAAAAEKELSKLVQEKMGKGYEEVVSAARAR